MLIKKSSKGGGFAVGTNAITDEKLTAGGIAAAILLIIGAIARARTTDKKKKRKKHAIRLASFPLLYKISKFAVSQAKLGSLVKRVENGEEKPCEKPSDGIFRSIEIIPAELVSSEAEAFEMISPEKGGSSDEKI